MIRLNQVIIKNFRNFQGEYQFDFSKDVTVFLGDNGNGKSSIFDAIQWCLTGGAERFNNIDSKETLKRVLINKNSNDCFVEITFSNDFILKRSAARTGNFSVFCKSEGKKKIFGVENVNQHIADVFKVNSIDKFNIQEFMESSLLAQDKVLDFIASDSANDRYRVLSSILGMDEITNLKSNYEQVRKRLISESEKKSEFVKALKLDINLKKKEIETNFENIDSEFKNNFDFENKQVERDNHLKNKVIIEDKIKTFNSQYEDVKLHIDDLNLIKETITSLEDEIKNLELKQVKILKDDTLNTDSIGQYDKNIEQAKKEKDHLSQNKVQRVALERIEQKLSNPDFYQLTLKSDEETRKSIPKYSYQLEKYRYTLSNIDEYKKLLISRKQIPKSISEGKEKIERIAHEIYTLKNKLNTLKSSFVSFESNDDIDSLIKLVQEAYDFVNNHQEFENTCPVCNQVVAGTSEHFDHRINNLLNQSKSAVEKIRIYREQIQEFEKDIENKSREMNREKIILSELQTDENEVENKIKIIEGNSLYRKDNFTLDRTDLNNYFNTSQKSIEKLYQYFELKDKKSTIERKLEENSEIDFLGLNLEQLLKDHGELLKKHQELSHLKAEIRSEMEGKRHSLVAMKKMNDLINDYSNTYKIEDSNIILKTLSDLVAEENKKIGTFTAELNNYKKIVQYNTLKEDLQKKEAAIVQPQLFINTIEDKFKIIEKEINKINDSYSFAQIVNNNESAIQQYFNYLNPNVSSYRNLHFNIDDVNSSLELEIVNNDSTVRADNVLSSGQLNVLAIAIFIAKNIGQKDSLIDFIAIDDPIQNMDDINQFSMIDVLSQLKKQVIFTTHDSKYVNLFLKKNELRLDHISVYYLDAENNSYRNILENS
ncbi:AAA family ATPase [Lactococcus lactis]|uniref:AAA family ATPase n=1 Tax=Lactococcus lactis TaxID=1358 RepID=UPI0024A6215B|nr:SMC family ATPase [Lactococcus lactis]